MYVVKKASVIHLRQLNCLNNLLARDVFNTEASLGTEYTSDILLFLKALFGKPPVDTDYN